MGAPFVVPRTLRAQVQVRLGHARIDGSVDASGFDRGAFRLRDLVSALFGARGGDSRVEDCTRDDRDSRAVRHWVAARILRWDRSLVQRSFAVPRDDVESL